MSVAEKLTIIAENMQGVYNKGFEDGQAQGGDNYYDTFWDTFQENGARRNYDNAFGYWKSAIINPKYKLKPYTANYMFRNTDFTDDELFREVDFSNCMEGNGLFLVCDQLKKLPILDFSSMEKCLNFLQHCYQLVSVEKIIIGEYLTFANNDFSLCRSLTEIRFEGEIKTDINFSWSPLSVDSMKDIIAHLEKDGWGTLTFSSACWEALEASGAAPDGGTWKSYVQNLGWSV